MSPFLRQLDGVEVHKGLRNNSQDNPTHWLISTQVQYQTTKIRSAAELETNLEKLGKDLGKRVLDALFHRDRLTKRELTEVGILQFISTTAWKALWGKAVDSA